MDDSRFYVLFNGILVISGQWEVDQRFDLAVPFTPPPPPPPPPARDQEAGPTRVMGRPKGSYMGVSFT